MTRLLSLERVSVSRHDGDRELRILNHLSLDLYAGELAVVWGPRRAGKTTLALTAAGRIRPDTGRVTVGEADLAKWGPRFWSLRRRTTLHPDIALVSGDQIEHRAEQAQVIDLLARQLRKRRLDRDDARRLALAALRDLDLEDRKHVPLRSLSRTERSLVAVLEALASQPRVVVIDDLTLGLDARDRDKIAKLLKRSADEHQLAILMITDTMTDAIFADTIAALQHGELVLAPRTRPAEVLPLPRRRSA
jgi:ABC-type multidrug transport system ATPase subunit